jgi:hypothetical protein
MVPPVALDWWAVDALDAAETAVLLERGQVLDHLCFP